MLKSRKAQVVIETTVAWLVLLIFLMGATGLFLWFNTSLVKRQKAYEATRLYAGKLYYDCTRQECIDCLEGTGCDPCGGVWGYGSSCDQMKPCFFHGVCHSPYVDNPEFAGGSFYAPEPLKVFQK